MKSRSIAFAAVLCAFVFTSNGAFARDGIYFGGGLHSTSIGGDFDGQTFFTSDFEAVVVPEIETGQGFAIFGGAHLNPVLSIEMDYLSSSHDASFAGVPLDVSYSEFSIYANLHFDVSEQLKPMALLGYGTSWIEVEDGAVDVNGNLGDATYTGSGFNLGIGAEYFVQSNVALGVRLIKRFASYDEVEGEIVEGSLSQELDGDTTTLMFTLAYHAVP